MAAFVSGKRVRGVWREGDGPTQKVQFKILVIVNRYFSRMHNFWCRFRVSSRNLSEVLRIRILSIQSCENGRKTFFLQRQKFLCGAK